MNHHVVEKLKPKVKKVVVAHMSDLLDREKRCDSGIKEMDKLLFIMRREKEDLEKERQKLEALIREVELMREEQQIGSDSSNDWIVTNVDNSGMVLDELSD